MGDLAKERMKHHLQDFVPLLDLRRAAVAPTSVKAALSV
jgi:hypothetical protein